MKDLDAMLTNPGGTTGVLSKVVLLLEAMEVNADANNRPYVQILANRGSRDAEFAMLLRMKPLMRQPSRPMLPTMTVATALSSRIAPTPLSFPHPQKLSQSLPFLAAVLNATTPAKTSALSIS